MSAESSSWRLLASRSRLTSGWRACSAQRVAVPPLIEVLKSTPFELPSPGAENCAPLVAVSAFDLGQDRLPGFASYRFLYERLLGAHARPWLPGAFCAAASLPHLHPDKRRLLLQSISEAAATAPGWSAREPSFYPEWVEKIDETKPAN